MKRIGVLVALGAVGFVVVLLVEPNLILGLRSPRTLAWIAGGTVLCALIGLLAYRLGAKPVLALTLAAIPAVIATGLFVVKPIVFPRELTEALPTAVASTAPSAVPSAAATVPVATKPAAAAPARLSTGRLTGLAGHSAKGQVSTYRLADGSQIIRFENVDIGGTPDPQVYLLPGRDRTGKRGGMHIGELKAEKGSFNYALPASFVGADFTVLVWCDRFAVDIAHATQA